MNVRGFTLWQVRQVFDERDALAQEGDEPPLEQKLDSLLAIKDMGDEQPMEFAQELQCLSADATLDDVLKRIFI